MLLQYRCCTNRNIAPVTCLCLVYTDPTRNDPCCVVLVLAPTPRGVTGSGNVGTPSKSFARGEAVAGGESR